MRLLFTLIFCCLSASLLADTVVIEATQDNTLYESSSGALSNGAGDFLFTGRTTNNGLRRAVVAFKNLDAIPPDAQIESVKLHLFVNRQNSDSSTGRLLRLTSDWGEGPTDAPMQEGGGSPAQTGSVTWNHRFFDNMTWNTPGGDFVGTASAEAPLGDFGIVTFGSNSTMVADVEGWLANPSSNFGWILIADESVQSARRLNSRESTPSRSPKLEIEFSSSGTTSGPTPGSDFSGPWFDSTLDGEGFLIYKTSAGWLIYYFGYTEDMERLWLVSNLLTIEDLEFGQEYELSMLVGEPGTFGMATPSSELTAWGILRILFYDCLSGLFTLDGIDGEKVYDAQKLIGVEGASCETAD